MFQRDVEVDVLLTLNRGGWRERFCSLGQCNAKQKGVLVNTI